MSLEKIEVCEETENPYKPGTLCQQLWAACNAAKEIRLQAMREPRKPYSKRSKPLVNVIALPESEAKGKLQKGSVRNQIVQFINRQDGKIASVAAIDTFLGVNCRGHLKKLCEIGRIASFDGEV